MQLIWLLVGIEHVWPDVQSVPAAQLQFSDEPQEEGRGAHAQVGSRSQIVPDSEVPGGQPPSVGKICPPPTVWVRTHTSPAPHVSVPHVVVPPSPQARPPKSSKSGGSHMQQPVYSAGAPQERTQT